MIHLYRIAQFFAAALVTMPTYAQELTDFRLGQATYGGSGCPLGMATIVISPNEKTFTLTLSQFIAQVYEMESRRMQTKTCTIAIPVQVPEGYRVRPNAMQFMGNYDVTYNARAQISVEAFFAGKQGPTFTHQFQSSDEYGQFIVENPTSAEAWVWSECGQSVILRMNIRLLANTRTVLGRSIITVDHVQPVGAQDALILEPCTP